MPKTPKSVTVILGLVIAGIQALVELIKVAKQEPKEKADDQKRAD